MNIEDYREIIKQKVNPQRYAHCLAVSEQAVRFARRFGADEHQALLAGLLHDITKDYTRAQHEAVFEKHGIVLSDVERAAMKLWHAISGAAVLQYELGIADAGLLAAVRYHTTARAGMSLLEKIIYLADFTSADRSFEGVGALRGAVEQSLENGLLAAYVFSIRELLEKTAAIHPDTVAAYNELVLKRANA